MCTKVCQHYEQNSIAQNDIILDEALSMDQIDANDVEKPNNSALTLHYSQVQDNNALKEEEAYKCERREQIEQETKDNCCIIF